MFDPMYAGDPFNDPLALALLGIALAGFLVGFLWIRRIIKDIEDN